MTFACAFNDLCCWRTVSEDVGPGGLRGRCLGWRHSGRRCKYACGAHSVIPGRAYRVCAPLTLTSARAVFINRAPSGDVVSQQMYVCFCSWRKGTHCCHQEKEMQVLSCMLHAHRYTGILQTLCHTLYLINLFFSSFLKVEQFEDYETEICSFLRVCVQLAFHFSNQTTDDTFPFRCDSNTCHVEGRSSNCSSWLWGDKKLCRANLHPQNREGFSLRFF